MPLLHLVHVVIAVCVCVCTHTHILARCHNVPLKTNTPSIYSQMCEQINVSAHVCVCVCAQENNDVFLESENIIFKGAAVKVKVKGQRLKDCVVSVRVLTNIDKQVCVCVYRVNRMASATEEWRPGLPVGPSRR